MHTDRFAARPPLRDRRRLEDVLAMVVAFWLVVATAVAAAGCGGGPPDEPENEMIAVLEPGAPLDRLLRDAGGAFVPLRGRAAPRFYGKNAPREGEPGVRFAEPVQRYDISLAPSDPSFERQWDLAAIHAEDGWDLVPSANGVVVAVVDTGCEPRHPDLAKSLWTNDGEIAGNGVDDDENGFVDDVHGWDFVDDDETPAPVGSDEAVWHGTHVGGTIAAGWGNRVGIAGLAPGARLICLRAMGNGTGRSDQVADAIDYAVENGARIVNMSLGGSYSRVIDEAIGRARAAGVLVVAAAGNSGSWGATFPASSDQSNVVGVGATDSRGVLASFSNRGPGVTVTAPGKDILSTFGPRGYATMSGTSMAAPHVTGAFALALAQRSASSASTLLRRLPSGAGGTRRLDLPSLLARARADDDPPTLSFRRKSVRFRIAGTRLPPPQTVNVDSPQPLAFRVSAPAWLKPGACRTAPCRLSLTLTQTALGAGSHKGEIRLSAAGGASAVLGVEVVKAARAPAPLAVEAVVDEDVFHPESALIVSTRSVVRLRCLSGGAPASARWSIDGVPAEGSELVGAFVREGRYNVVAARAGEGEVGIMIDAAADGGTIAAPDPGVP